MNDINKKIRRRLTRIFIAILPQINVDDIENATMDNTDNWDSLATLSLFTLAEEEFGIKLGLDLIVSTKSFVDFEKLIISKID